MHLKECFFRISFLYNLIPVQILMKIAGKKVLFPFYHFVSDGNNNLVNNLYKVKNTTQFSEDLRFFKKHFISLSLNDLKEKTKNNGFLLSFDDGLSNFYNIVAPILQREEVAAINFLNSNFIDNKDLFYRYKVNILIDFLENNILKKEQQTAIHKFLQSNNIDRKSICNALKKIEITEVDVLDNFANILGISFSDFLRIEKPYLSEKQIQKLINIGFSFGAHSKNHPRYSLISLESQLNETIESIEVLNKKFNIKHNSFSFPFSDYGVSNDFFNQIKSKKITTFGTAGIKDDTIENHYQRVQMEWGSIYTAETIIKGELIIYVVKRLFGRHKIVRT